MCACAVWRFERKTSTTRSNTRMSDRNSAPFLFEGIFSKPLLSKFDSELRTSDGGASLLGAIDRKTKLTESLCSELVDPRDAKRIEHSYLDLFRQRVFSIALGYPDGNDAEQIGHDPIMKLVCGRKPTDKCALGSQPTLSRFEHAVTGREVVALGRKLEKLVIERVHHRNRHARLITIDLDGSVDPTHGQQPFAFFSGYYDSWCYFPLLGFITVDDKPEQHLFHARLRPGASREARSTPALLRRTVANLRKTFKKAKIRVRLDSGFACPLIYDTLEELRVEYVVGLPENSVLKGRCSREMHASQVLTERFGKTTTFFGETDYAARSWHCQRRVVFKAEVVHAEGKAVRRNTRFLVTNLRHKPQRAWELYCKRGDSENRIKELKGDLEIDRTSCTSYIANQFRVLLAATAYVLFQDMRAVLGNHEFSRSTVGTLRARLLKIGATVTETARRIVISMPSSYPWTDPWRRAAASIAAFA